MGSFGQTTLHKKKSHANVPLRSVSKRDIESLILYTVVWCSTNNVQKKRVVS
jgi:hypothetical protein